MFQDIFVNHTYRPYNLQYLQGKTVIDIGANVGIFCLYALSCGCSNVIAIEPEPSNYKELLHNISPYNNVATLNIGISDGQKPQSCMVDSGIMARLTEEQTQISVQLHDLEYIVSKYADDKSNLFLKLDCEQSEFEILTSSSRKTLRKFAYIAGEFHAMPQSSKYNIEFINTYMSYAGFRKCLANPMHIQSQDNLQCCPWIETAHFVRVD